MCALQEERSSDHHGACDSLAAAGIADSARGVWRVARGGRGENGGMEAHQRLADRYELGEVIGRGGMGTVYRAVDSVLGRPVAVKILRGPLAEHDSSSVARFKREARAAASLNHPAVVAVYDTGADDTSRFIVMELVVGRSLEAILRQGGPLDPDRAAEIAAQVADALAAAHRAGIVHRDIKPANVMVAGDGTVKVLDFGIARAIDGATLTQNAVVLGTVAYMSPEQAAGRAADERSDIYSLGCVLYAMLAGHPPFTGDGAAAVLYQHANIAPRPLRDEGNHVPRSLEAVMLEMLEKSPDRRPQSAAQVHDRLTTSGAGSPVTAADGAGSAVHRHSAASIERLARWSRGSSAVVGLAGAVAGLIAVILAIVLSSGGGSPHTAAGAHRHASTAKTTVGSRQATSATTSSTVATQATGSGPRTVSAAAGALTALVTQDVKAGTIDQQAAQQIGNGLSNILNLWDMGNGTTARQQFVALSQQVTMLEQNGRITSHATPAIAHAITNLGAALANTTPPKSANTHPTHPGPHPAKPGHGKQPPGHGGKPPGHTKHHGHHGHHGD